MSKKRWIAGAVSAAALLASAGASATTLNQLSFGEMVSSASACVSGEVIGSSVIERDGAVYTQTQFRVTKTAFGNTDNVITVETSGGAKKLGRLRAAEVNAGTPVFFENQERLLLVTPNASGTMDIVGYNQGSFPILNGSVTLPGTLSVLSVDDAFDAINDTRSNSATGEISE